MSEFHVSFGATGDEFTVDFENVQEVSPAEYYEGSYNVTPTQAQQVLPTQGLVSLHDFVIEPIPSNYGLITWNGSTLTVS